MERLFGANSDGVGISRVLMSEFVTNGQDNSGACRTGYLPHGQVLPVAAAVCWRRSLCDGGPRRETELCELIPICGN